MPVARFPDPGERGAGQTPVRTLARPKDLEAIAELEKLLDERGQQRL
jgi:hypothetical protein